MTKIKCDCGNLVCEGDVINQKFLGKIKKVNLGLIRDLKMNGELKKNNSNDPKDWSGVCSECQSKRDKK